MEACVCIRAPWPAFSPLRRLFLRACAGLPALCRAFAANTGTAAASREALNEQAAVLFDRWGNSILRLAYSYLHSREDAEEVLQDTLIQYVRTAPQLDSAEHEKAWLLHVAANLSKNRIQYNRLRGTDELNEELAGEEREDLSFVWEAVKALPQKYREVIHLFYHEGYETAQIAAILGENEATVRSHLSRGRARLKTVLKEAYDFAE